mgnify:CR=1 FL=1
MNDIMQIKFWMLGNLLQRDNDILSVKQATVQAFPLVSETQINGALHELMSEKMICVSYQNDNILLKAA